MFAPAPMSRRGVLALGAVLLAQSSLAGDSAQASWQSRLFLSAATDQSGKHWLQAFSLASDLIELKYKVQLPARAHHIAIHSKSNLALVVARRPGNFLLLLDLQSGKLLQQITVPADRHLLGHGIFSADGQYFFTVESDFEDRQGDSGRVVRWQVSKQADRALLTREKDFSSYGVGPHELLLMPDQTTLVLANGGIRTHPDSGREKLNLETMQASLTYIDLNTAKLIEQQKFPVELHKASIRHLDINSTGTVALAMQYEGEAFTSVPLVATHTLGQTLNFLTVPAEQQRQMKQYVGSIKFDNSGRFIAASCPRGNMITFWDTHTQQFLNALRSRDGCGLSASENGFVFTAGSGLISYYDLLADELQRFSMPVSEGGATEKILWDNHLS